MNKKTFWKAISVSAFCLVASQTSLYAWVPPASKPVCAECRGEDGQHKESCPFYRETSTKLKDYTPIPEIPYIPSTCPHCHRTNGNHAPDCVIAYCLKRIQHYREQYDEARTKKDRDFAVFNLKRLNENIEQMKRNAASGEEDDDDYYDEWNYKDDDEGWYFKNKQKQQQKKDAFKAQNQQLQNNSNINIPQTTHIVNSSFPKDCDKKITFYNIPGALSAYGKTSPDGKEEWHFYDKNGRDKFGYGFSSVETIEYGNQHYFIAKNSYTDSYTLLDPTGFGLGSFKKLTPIKKGIAIKDNDPTGAKGTKTTLLFICQDISGTGYQLYDPIRKTGSSHYDSIETTGINPDYPMIKVMNKGYYGIVSPLIKDFVAKDGRIFTKDKTIVPPEYTYVKERYTLKEKLPYYIVSKDGQKFGAYNCNGKMVLQMKYSFAQIEEKIDKKQFRRR